MSSKKNKDELIFPTKEEMDNQSAKFDDPIYRYQAAIDMMDEGIAFNKKHELITKSIQRIDTINSLWCIAEDMRQRKEAGEFPTYIEAYGLTKWRMENCRMKRLTFKLCV